MNKIFLSVGSAALAAIAGCSSHPQVTVADRLADEQTRNLVQESVWVVHPKDARRYDDPAWPAPIQIVPPVQKKGDNKGAYDVHLFGGEPTGQHIDTIYVRNGRSGECKLLLEYLGLTASDHAFIELNGGGQEYFLCDSVVFSMGADRVKNPFISSYREIEFLAHGGEGVLGEADDSGTEALDTTKQKEGSMTVEQALQGRFPIKIRYIK